MQWWLSRVTRRSCETVLFSTGGDVVSIAQLLFVVVERAGW